MEELPATAVGLKIKDAVVLGSERRLSYGGYVMSKSAKKVHKLGNYGLAGVGLFGDFQTLTRIMKVEFTRYKMDSGRPIPVKAAAKLLSTILYQYKYTPFISELIFGGVDAEGSQLFILDPVGSLIPDRFASVGSGARVAIGILENSYKESMNLEEAKDIVEKSIRASIERDVLSGDGIDLLVITGNAVHEEFRPL